MTFTPVPKPPPMWKNKAKKKADELREIKRCYAAVDHRDGPQCRLCLRLVGGLSMDRKRIHHHIVFRSRGGEHITSNVISICPRCDDLIHREGTLQVTGNADTLNSQGQFCGVKVERLTEAGWKIEGLR